MKNAKLVRGVVGLVLLVVGFFLTRQPEFHEKVYLMDTTGCRMETAFWEPVGGSARGSVVLFHGLSANRKLMSYVAQGFALQGLQVIVPDLPGHGHTVGPFSAARADECGESLVRELIVRGIVQPERTILAGHSMGGAIALRVASRIATNAATTVPLAGVIAISPAPMKVAPGVSPELLLYKEPPPLPTNTLIINGGWESSLMKNASRDLMRGHEDGSAKYVVIPHATHVSLLFDPRVAREDQSWAAQVLHLDGTAPPPSRRGVRGAILGLVGLLILLGPFLQETVGLQKDKRDTQAGIAPRLWVSLLVFTSASFLAVEVLHLWAPVQNVRVFQADYFAGFLVIVAFVVLLAKREALRTAFAGPRGELLAKSAAAAFAGMVSLLLLAAWFELSFSEAWWKVDRWERFPLLLVLLIPYHLAEELILGPVDPARKLRRLELGFLLRFVGWGALVVGLVFLHSGAILLVLLAPYLFLFHLLQRRGMDVVREGTGSALAAAIFGAILLAGFCLVTFPVT